MKAASNLAMDSAHKPAIAQIIKAEIPLVELLECVEALRVMRLAVANDGFEPVCNNPLSESAFTHSTIKMELALANLDAKLKEI